MAGSEKTVPGLIIAPGGWLEKALPSEMVQGPFDVVVDDCIKTLLRCRRLTGR
jgi:hypothetical protein